MKIQELTTFFNSHQFANDVKTGVVSWGVATLFKKAIAKHQQMLDSMKAQANQANVTGQQVGTTLGMRMTGEVNQETGRSLSQEQMVAADEAASPEMTPGGLEIPSFA
jgi:hypothetical protein